MALYTSAWGRPIQGVSQQPPKNRAEGQCTTQVNMLPSPVRGLHRRNGTFHVSDTTVSQLQDDNLKVHTFESSDGHFYTIMFSSNGYSAFKDGIPTLTHTGLPAYLQSPNPKEDLYIKTIADTTFIVNKKVVPQKSTVTSGNPESRALVNVQFADYGREYAIFINGVQVSNYKTPTGSDANDIEKVDTSFVAQKLYENHYADNNLYRIFEPLFDSGGTIVQTFTRGGIDYEAVYSTPAYPIPENFLYYKPVGSAGLNQLAGFDVVVDRNVIIFTKLDGTPFTIETKDGARGQDLIAILGKVQSVGQLPTSAPDNYLVEVVGSGSRTEPYYLRAESRAGGTVRWVETIAPLTSQGLDKNTMPHTLVFDSGGLVTVSVADWGDRLVGTETTNPDPSFIIDQVPIIAVGVFQNRLILLAGESIVMSASNRFFDLYRSTVQDLLDDHPIDVYADTDRVNTLYSYAVLDGDLVLFSPNGQFLVSGAQPATPSNTTLKWVSSFETFANANPVASGNVIFFPTLLGGNTGIRELYTDSIVDTKMARPLTEHVPSYIRGAPELLVSSSSRDILIVLAEDKSRLYHYHWVWQGNERVQSAWGEWVFPGTEILHVHLRIDQLILILRRGSTLSHEYIDLSDSQDFGLGFQLKLDRKRTFTATYQSGGIWAAPVSFPPDADIDQLVVIQGVGCDDVGSEVQFEVLERNGSTLILRTSDELGDIFEEKTLIAGLRYESVYSPTMPFIRDQSGRVIDTDRLVLNDANINYDLVGDVDVVVQNDYGQSRVYNFNGRVLGAADNIVGFAQQREGRFRFPIRQQSDRVQLILRTDDPYEFQLRDMEWRGKFKQRGRRV